MATAQTRQIDELLAGTLDRDRFGQLVDCIYASYASVDQADRRIRQMEADLEGSSGEAERDLTEKLGILLLARGQFAEAAQRLRAVRTRKNAARFLARAYLSLRREQEALELLLDQADEDPEAAVLAVEAYCSLRQPDEARKVLKKHLGGDESADLRYAQGRIADADGDYARAVEHYEAALELDPEHAGSLFHLAQCVNLNGDDDRAIELYRRCANLKPTYVGALVNLGILYEDHGRYAEAVDCYKRVLAIDPRHKQARLYLRDAESSLTMYVDATRARSVRRMEEVLSLPLSTFELSARSRNCLDRKDITTLGSLTKVTRDELLTEKNFGDTSLEEIESLMARYDLEIGEATSESPEEAPPENLSMSVEMLELTTRCRRCLERLGARTLDDVTELTEADLLGVPNFGATSLNEIVTKLAALGLSLKAE